MKNCVIEIASFVSEVEPLDAPGKPFRQRDHYSNNILCIYALHDAPCDSSDALMVMISPGLSVLRLSKINMCISDETKASC